MAYQSIPAARPVRYTTLSGAATSITVSGLNPVSDGDYDVWAYVPVVQANSTFEWRPNASASNCISVSTNVFNGGRRNDTSWLISNAAASPQLFAATNVVVMEGVLIAKTGFVREFSFRWMLYTGSTTNDMGYVHCYWNDTSTALASLQLISAVANGYGTGAIIRLIARGNTSVP